MTRYKQIIFLVCCLIALAFTSFSQEVHTCSFDEEYARLMQDEDFRRKQELLEEGVRNLIAKRRQSISRSSSSYTIPVVIHIITPPGTSIGSGNNLSNEEVEKGLSLLNQSFSNTGPFQTSDGHDIGIQFCLARRTPDGQATNGITRHESDLVNEMKCNGPSTNKNSNAAIKKIVNWNCKDYLNIWLVTDLYSDGLGCSLAGFAYFPGAPCSVDGIMQESRYWTTVRGTQVTAHEVGHYLNLHHTFNGGCKNDDCTRDGDRVCDTPPDSSPSFAPCDTNSCDTDSPDLPDDNTNYMDYTSCTPLHFTQGQKDRMIAGLEVGRASLLTSLGCQPTLALDAQLQYIADVESSCSEDYCPEVTIRNVGSDMVTKVALDIYIDGGRMDTYEWSGALDFGVSESVQLPCYSLSPGSHTSYVEIKGVNNSTDLNNLNNTSRVLNIDVYENPSLTLTGVDTTRCGNNGAIYVKASGGEEPYRYRLLSSDTYQSSPIFSDLVNKEYSIEVVDANECKDTIIYTVPDVCPPCLSGIINKYAAVENICQNTFTVDNIIGFTEGAKVLIYQAQGATVDLTNTPSFGDVVDYGNAGNYEYNVIETINDKEITFRYKVFNTYDVPGNPQIITVPNLGNETVCNLTCEPWNGRTGGVLVFDADTITMVGNIDVSGKGFRGGSVERIDHNGISLNIPDYFNGDSRYGARKGEGIVVLHTPYLNCRGKAANGGGGGNNHNAGGGGGSNAGKGGNSGQFNTQIKETTAIGGEELSFDGKLFLGGGGGAGHDNNYKGTSGANGGGAIFLRSKRIIAESSVFINANGVDAKVASIDASGGGGGGGSLALVSEELDSRIEFYAIGGKGGDNHSDYNAAQQCHGTGGGGGGGCIYSSQVLETYSLNGGVRGLLLNTFGPPLCPDIPPGGIATAGSDGKVINSFTPNIANELVDTLSIEEIKVSTLCSGHTHVEVKAKGSGVSARFEMNGSVQTDDSQFVVEQAGWYTISLVGTCLRQDTSIYLNVAKALEIDLKGIAPRTCIADGNITILGQYGLAPYDYRLHNQGWKSDGHFVDLAPGQYTATVRDARGCEVSIEVSIDDQSSQLKIQIDSSNLIINCSDKDTYIALSTLGSDPYHFYSLDGGTEVSNPYFENLEVGIHSIVSRDEYGCVSDVFSFEVLDESQPVFSEAEVEACTGSDYIVGNSVYTEPGSYTDTLVASNGCDSILTTQLSFSEVLMNKQDVEICKGEIYNVGNNAYVEKGIYIDTLETNYGCDSILTTTLSILDIAQSEQEVKLCAGESHVVNTNEYIESGTYLDTLVATNGCDSILTTRLWIHEQSVSTIDYTICQGDTLVVENTTYTDFGEYEKVLLDANGCDSLAYIDIKKASDAYCDSLYCTVTLPNAFSPDGNGVNDYFEFSSTSIEIESFSIYDRWGNKVYTSKGDKIRWDGFYGSQALEQGVYLYFLTGRCRSGTAWKKVGDVTIIRRQ